MKARMATVAEQRENWKETAKFHLKNEEHYRDAWERAKSELKIERAKVAMLNDVREAQSAEIERLKGNNEMGALGDSGAAMLWGKKGKRNA